MQKITKMNSDDRRQIEGWDRYHHTDYESQYQEILSALETCSIKEYIARVIKSQSNVHKRERFAYVLRNDENKIVAFVFFYLHRIDKGGHDMFIQSIVTHPKYRRQGHAKELLGTIFANPYEYIGERPHDVGGLVFRWNIESLKLFDNFAKFDEKPYLHNMYLLLKDYNTVERNARELYKNDNIKNN